MRNSVDANRRFEFLLGAVAVHFLANSIVGKIAAKHIVPLLRVLHVLEAPTALNFVVLDARGDFRDAGVIAVVGGSVPTVNFSDKEKIARQRVPNTSILVLKIRAVAFGPCQPCPRPRTAQVEAGECAPCRRYLDVVDEDRFGVLEEDCVQRTAANDGPIIIGPTLTKWLVTFRRSHQRR